MSLLVSGVASATNPSLSAANLLTDLNLTTVQQAQISQIMAELQTGTITTVEARAQINQIIAAQQQQSDGSTSSPATQSQPDAASQSSDQSYASHYELPLPQEELPKGALSAYTWSGATNTAPPSYSTPQVVNSTA